MPTRTQILPELFQPNSALARQEIIKKIQKITGRKLIVFTANPQHPFASIMQQDVPLFEDMLRSVSDSKKADLMISSSGGDPNAAEKMLMMCRGRFPEEFNVIVPNLAKSAATMISIGSDKILMGYAAELGPIDPQIERITETGNREMLPAKSFIEGLEIVRQKVKEGDPPQMYLSMMAQIRPEILSVCENAISESREFAQRWLKQYMMKDQPEQAEETSRLLIDEYKSHGKVINFIEAKDRLKLNVEMIDFNSDLWNLVWELYCRSIQFIQVSPPNGSGAKLYESESVSLTMNVKITRAPRN